MNSGAEELSAQVLEESESGGCLLQTAPALACPVEHGPDQREAGALPGEASDHLAPPAGFAEGPLQQIGVPDPLPVFPGKAQVGGQAVEVADDVGPPGPNDLASVASPQLLLSVAEAARALGIARSSVYVLLDRHELTSVSIGRRRLLPARALEEYVDRLIERSRC